MGMTISTHNGTSAHRGHNIRLESVISKQDHINPDGHFEIWHDEAPREAYERIFGEYVQEYNAKQKRPERQIKDYYADVCNDKKRNAVYEMIVSVGNMENRPPEETCRAILHDFMYGNDDIGYPSAWTQRNSSFELIGAYYHADEQGVPHLHIDYVPVATGYQRGMFAQNGLDKALREMGFEHKGNHATPQIQWEKAENERLERLCQYYGLEIEHPMADKGVQHVHTELYKAKAESNKAQAEMKAEIGNLEAKRTYLENEVSGLGAELQELEQKKDRILKLISGKVAEYKSVEQKLGLAEEKVSEAEVRVSKAEARMVEAEGELEGMIEQLQGFKKDFKGIAETIKNMKGRYPYTDSLIVYEKQKQTDKSIGLIQDFLQEHKKPKKKSQDLEK